MGSHVLTLDILRKLPKADLHCHLDGFARPATVKALAEEQGIDLGVTDLSELASQMTVPLDCPDLVTYLKTFDIVLKVMQQPYAITRIFYEACEDAVKDGITYIELRFAPVLHTRNDHSYSQILEAAIAGCTLAGQRLPITPRIICCAMRQMDPKINTDIAEVVWRYRNRFVVGFDLAGPEKGHAPDRHIHAFRTVRHRSISATIHAGEAFGAQSIKLALQCSAQRLGHGTRIFEDERVLREVVDRRIPLEICVSSNVQTKAVQRLENHPVRRLFEIGARVCPCTDNPTVSGVTLSGEYLLLHQKFGFSVADILKMIDFGFRSAFVDDRMGRQLRLEAFLRSMQVLTRHGIDLAHVDTSYYSQLGVSVPPRFVPPVRNPPVTLHLLRQIPKCDLDCRLIGSVPMPVLFEFFQQTPIAGLDFASEDDLRRFCMRDSDMRLKADAKELSTSLLQTEANLRRATSAVLQEAFDDKVLYLELTVCPVYHTRQGLTKEQVLDCILDEVQQFTAAHEIQVSLVINANVVKLGPVTVHKLAKLAVSYLHKGVVGFATTTGEVTISEMRFFEATFNYLSNNFVPVTIFAGETTASSVTEALVQGQARRISGGFKITQSESVLNDVVSHHVAVLVSLSQRMQEAMTEEGEGWKKSSIRYFFDFGVELAFCSIHNAFGGLSRSEQLLKLCEEGGIGAAGLLKIMDNTF
jgi:adenosine deaminase